MTDRDPVRASYERCYETGDFGAVFYDNFFKQSPDIAPYFANTDFVAQKRHFRASLLTLIKHTPGDAVTTPLLEKLGHSHSRGQMNVRPDLYPLFGAALFETLQACDPQWNAELEQTWKDRITPGVTVMISLYDVPVSVK